MDKLGRYIQLAAILSVHCPAWIPPLTPAYWMLRGYLLHSSYLLKWATTNSSTHALSVCYIEYVNFLLHVRMILISLIQWNHCFTWFMVEKTQNITHGFLKVCTCRTWKPLNRPKERKLCAVAQDLLHQTIICKMKENSGNQMD